MLPRITLAVAALIAAAPLIAAGPCPRPTGREAPACNAQPTPTSITACTTDARHAESCANHETGLAHALHLVQAATEWTKAAQATGSHTKKARQWLAHAIVLDERVQDDPTAPQTLRHQAELNERSARQALTPH